MSRRHDGEKVHEDKSSELIREESTVTDSFLEM
jgi:hypothetical protein